MITQAAGVDQRADQLIVTSYSRTTKGLWIAADSSILDAIVDDVDLGNDIREALNRSELGVPHPTRDELAQLQREWLRTLGMRSVSAYMKGTRSVAVHTHDEGHIALTPTENRGRDGFVEIQEAKTLLPGDTPPLELAGAVRAALDQALPATAPASPSDADSA